MNAILWFQIILLFNHKILVSYNLIIYLIIRYLLNNIDQIYFASI
jgi:hypothetical protein